VFASAAGIDCCAEKKAAGEACRRQAPRLPDTAPAHRPRAEVTAFSRCVRPYRNVMKLLLKLALVLAVALLLHASITPAYITYNAGALRSGEWKRADAEAIGGVWNINRNRVDPATQPTAANEVNDDTRDVEEPGGS
jgi:hypothetical protein